MVHETGGPRDLKPTKDRQLIGYIVSDAHPTSMKLFLSDGPLEACPPSQDGGRGKGGPASPGNIVTPRPSNHTTTQQLAGDADEISSQILPTLMFA